MTSIDTEAATTVFVECDPDGYGPNFQAAADQTPEMCGDGRWVVTARSNGYLFRWLPAEGGNHAEA